MTQDTLPTQKNTSVSKFNSLQFGLRSQYTVLPWENRDEYLGLVQELAEHHNPIGPTESHLVEEIAGIIWRKQRVLMAEGSLFRKEMADDVATGYGADKFVAAAVIGKAPAHLNMGKVSLACTVGTEEDRNSLGHATQALEIIRKLRAKVAKAPDYAKAFFMLPEDLRESYESRLGEEMVGFTPKDGDPELVYDYGTEIEDLLYFLDSELIPNLEGQTLQHRYVEDIANQLKGQAFNPEKLELIGRYETHLDRKLEKMLGMLIKIQEIRRATGGA